MIIFTQEDFTINPKKMKIAVVGAGFAGLSVAWNLLSLNPKVMLTLWDPNPIEKRASANAFLLHPFIHFKSKLNWEGWRAYKESKKLLKSAQLFGSFSFFIERPFIKLANHTTQVEPFKEAGTLYPELEWLEKTSYGYPGLKVLKAIQLDATLYLKALQKGCLSKGASIQKSFFSKEMEKEYDQVIYTMGSQSLDFFPQLQGSKVKGQLAVIRSRESLVLPSALTAYKCHIIPSFDQKTLKVGSTFERKFADERPDLKRALELLNPHIEFLLGRLSALDVISISSGVRLNATDRLPLVGQLSSKAWLLSALGSKGVLYHGWLGKLLAEHVLGKTTAPLPSELNIERSIH